MCKPGMVRSVPFNVPLAALRHITKEDDPLGHKAREHLAIAGKKQLTSTAILLRAN